MKTVLFLMTAFIATLANKPTIWELEPNIPVSTTEIKIGEQTHYNFTITGINSQVVRTAEKVIKIELFAEEETGKSPVSERDFFATYAFDVRDTDDSIEAQLDLKNNQNPDKKLHKWLVIHMPEVVGFRLNSKDKISFGTGFQGMDGFYSGTIEMGAENEKNELIVDKGTGSATLLNETSSGTVRQKTGTQIKVDAEEIIAQINRGEAVAYKNVLIEGHLNMTQLANKKVKLSENPNVHTSTHYVSTITAPVSFINCTFRGQVLGYFNSGNFSPNQKSDDVKAAQDGWHDDMDEEVFNADFEQEVRFDYCTFEQEVAFKYSEFKGKVSFAGSYFQNVAVFKYAKFTQSPDFSKTSFQGAAVFKYVIFPAGANYSQATFHDVTSFKYAEFPAGVNFRSTAFPGYVDFKYAKLSKPQLQGTTFKGSQDFKYTEVDGRRSNLAELVD